jgi:hypothetical protein
MVRKRVWFSVREHLTQYAEGDLPALVHAVKELEEQGFIETE